MKIKKINRKNKTKDKKGSSCKMCKPHKNGWKQMFKLKDKERMRLLNEQVEEEVSDSRFYDS